MTDTDLDRWHMTRSLELAAQGRGHVEPNPLVGCVVAQGAEIIGEGWHCRYGGAHAEVEALQVAGPRAVGATLVVTLEPCCHWGKTPPCSQAVIQAGIRRVVVAMRDPFPQVAGGGLAELRAAGIEVEVGVLEEHSRRLNAPYLKLLKTARPWVVAKWAMTLDGKLATRARSSQWISSAASRAIVHELRGRMDAILVGRGTVEADDPQLTARPPGPRTAVRIVMDRQARTPLKCQLVRTARETPTLIAAGAVASTERINLLRDAGCEVWQAASDDSPQVARQLLDELGRRRMTNLLIEGGAEILGAFFDAQLVDEAHVFIAPKIAGGRDAPSPVAGMGVELMQQALQLQEVKIEQVGEDVYVRGLVGSAECKVQSAD